MDVLSRYRVNHNSSSSEDDSEDSDNDCAVWKRATNKKTSVNEHLQTDVMNEEHIAEKEKEIEQPQPVPEQPKPGQKRKRNTIWCDVLQDQLISEDLEDCLLNKPRNYGSRGKESYDYTRAYNNEKRRDSESEMSGCSLNDDSGADSNTKSQNKHSFIPPKKFKKYVKLNSMEFDAARKINKILNEKKYYLIQRIVKYVGIEKAMHLLELTKEIEDNGGMMIKSHTRRRTPGGVYIQMLKEDKEVTQKMLDKIFEGEMSGLEVKKYFEERKRKKKYYRKSSKGASKRGVVEADIEPMEPGEIATMDDEVIIERKPGVQSSDISVPFAPITAKKSSENVSDLEEGEIED